MTERFSVVGHNSLPEVLRDPAVSGYIFTGFVKSLYYRRRTDAFSALEVLRRCAIHFSLTYYFLLTAFLALFNIPQQVTKYRGDGSNL